MITCGCRIGGRKIPVTKTVCGEPATKFFKVKIINKISYRFRCDRHKNMDRLHQYEITEISENEAIVIQVMNM
jgi:hypothetical protein